MSLKPEEMTYRLSIEYIRSGREPLGEHLPEQLVTTEEVQAKRELVSGRKARALDQQQVVETCFLTTHPNLNINIDWRITTSDRVYTVRNVKRLVNRVIITGEADARHDQAGVRDST